MHLSYGSQIFFQSVKLVTLFLSFPFDYKSTGGVLVEHTSSKYKKYMCPGLTIFAVFYLSFLIARIIPSSPIFAPELAKPSAVLTKHVLLIFGSSFILCVDFLSLN